MPVTTTESGRGAAGPRPVWRRLGCFAVLWAGSLGVWLLIAYGLRSLLVAG
jgi:hypothetical protein